jgi:hypothetical protein
LALISGPMPVTSPSMSPITGFCIRTLSKGNGQDLQD